MYYVSYGPYQAKAETLKEIRAIAKEVSYRTLYEIEIIHNGEVIEKLVPSINLAGRVTFKRKAGAA